MTAITTLYGIPNCSTVKKARQWLSDHSICYVFHDFKKSHIDIARLEHWAHCTGMDKLLNRQGSTWRTLSDIDKARAESMGTAIILMQQQTSLIKRPVLEYNGKIVLGFNETTYATLWHLEKP